MQCRSAGSAGKTIIALIKSAIPDVSIAHLEYYKLRITNFSLAKQNYEKVAIN